MGKYFYDLEVKRTFKQNTWRKNIQKNIDKFDIQMSNSDTTKENIRLKDMYWNERTYWQQLWQKFVIPNVWGTLKNQEEKGTVQEK